MAKGAVLYTRVSTAEQAASNNSLSVQENKGRDYCQKQGLNVVKVFSDRGESARAADREQFQAMLTFCRQHKKDVSHVIVSDLSRFSRNVRDQANHIVDLAESGVKLLSVDEAQIDESAAGKLAQGMIGVFNQYFSDALSERTKFRMKAGVENGRWLWKSPIGYRNDKNTKTVVIDNEASTFVRKAFSLVTDPSYTSSEPVLRLLTAMGFKTAKDKPVSRQTFEKMLKNPFYAGWVVSGDIRVQGNHEALITQEQFDRVQEKLADNSNGKITHKKVNEDFPLRGFVKCAGCGKNLTAAWSRGKGGQRFAYYFCWNKQCKAKVTVPREQIEWKYFELLCAHEANSATLAKLPIIAARMWAQRQETIANDAKLLTRQLEDQKTLNTKLITAKLKGEITQNDFELMKANIEAETQKIEDEIKAFDSEKSKMEALIKQREKEPVNFGFAWRDAPFYRKIEMQKVFYPDGLAYSPKRFFFEPQNKYLMQQLANLFSELLDLASPTGFEPVLSP